jgi:hypothetical protein
LIRLLCVVIPDFAEGESLESRGRSDLVSGSLIRGFGDKPRFLNFDSSDVPIIRVHLSLIFSFHFTYLPDEL